jgi:signal transduction histidine kinase
MESSPIRVLLVEDDEDDDHPVRDLFVDSPGTNACDAREVVITVRDTGVGIAPEFLPHVFDLFRQADHSLDRADGGLGIGLTLVKSFAELRGGSVRAASDGHGRGSEFVVPLNTSEGYPSGTRRRVAISFAIS